MTDIQAIMIDINQPKSDLLRIYSKLMEKGMTKQANQLEKIIEKLESFQNR